jgi:hypothetical protein
VPHERPHINRRPIVAIAVVIAAGCMLELGMEIHERWKAPDVQSTDQLEHSTTGEATRRAGARLIPSNPKLASEPATAGPKPKQPASDD